MAELEKAFGKTLRDLRNQKALSQEALGFEADLARNYISQLELGCKSPSLRTIFKLCAVLQISPADLMRALAERLPDGAPAQALANGRANGQGNGQGNGQANGLARSPLNGAGAHAAAPRPPGGA